MELFWINKRQNKWLFCGQRFKCFTFYSFMWISLISSCTFPPSTRGLWGKDAGLGKMNNYNRVGNHFIIFISVADPTACNFIHLLSFVKHSLILLILYLFCLFFSYPLFFLFIFRYLFFSSCSHRAGIMNTTQWSQSEIFQRSIIPAPHIT